MGTFRVALFFCTLHGEYDVIVHPEMEKSVLRRSLFYGNTGVRDSKNALPKTLSAAVH